MHTELLKLWQGCDLSLACRTFTEGTGSRGQGITWRLPTQGPQGLRNPPLAHLLKMRVALQAAWAAVLSQRLCCCS